MIIQSALLAEIANVAHGFGTRQDPLPAAIAGVWPTRKPEWKQVHGVGVAEVSAESHLCGEVDALFTREAGQPIAVVTADCVPILLAREDGAAVAAVHAGWRGTRARILEALWARLAGAGEKPTKWMAAIGPAIGPCCYQVSEEIAADFAREFSAMGSGRAIPAPRMLDLPAINQHQLHALGIARVEILRYCTKCALDPASGEPLFHSYRREGGGTRQFSGVVTVSG